MNLRNLLTDVPGVLVGNAEDLRLGSGSTAVIFEQPAVASIDVRGGGPGTRETALLDPAQTVEGIDAITLSGGSAFGLDAASGVQAWLKERGRGFAVGAARVPIVPAVSIGGQETQLFLIRGNWLAKRLRLKRFRIEILPLTIGFPFGLTLFFPANMPFPAKIVYQVLEPIDIAARFGEDPDADEVDAYVRSVMQAALNGLGRERRFPLVG